MDGEKQSTSLVPKSKGTLTIFCFITIKTLMHAFYLQKIVFTCITTLIFQDYKADQDPSIFKSEKTGRGPLGPDWKVLSALFTFSEFRTWRF